MVSQNKEQYETCWDHLGIDIRSAQMESLKPIWKEIFNQFQKNGLTDGDILFSLYLAMLDMGKEGRNWELAIDLISESSHKAYKAEQAERLDAIVSRPCTCEAE